MPVLDMAASFAASLAGLAASQAGLATSLAASLADLPACVECRRPVSTCGTWLPCVSTRVDIYIITRLRIEVVHIPLCFLLIDRSLMTSQQRPKRLRTRQPGAVPAQAQLPAGRAVVISCC
jgi:hypothetical protein